MCVKYIFFIRCDAEPGSLAKYCFALVRKDKPEEETKDDMLQQLDVFLQERKYTNLNQVLVLLE